MFLTQIMVVIVCLFFEDGYEVILKYLICS